MTHGVNKKTTSPPLMMLMMMPWKRCKSAVFLALGTTLLALMVVTVVMVVVVREQRDTRRGPQLLAARRSLQGAGPLPPRDSSLFQWSTNHDDEDEDAAAAAEWEELGDEWEESEAEWAGPAAAAGGGRGFGRPRMGEPRGVRDGRRRRRRRPAAVGGRATPSGRPTGWDVHVTNCTANSSMLGSAWYEGLEERFKDFVLYRHCRFFALIHDSAGRCSRATDDGVAPYLLFVIKSTCANHARRDAIRRTWGREVDYHLSTSSSLGSRPLRVRTLFLVGLATPTDDGSHRHLQKLVDFESQIYGDILQWDFLDTFYNLTLKEVNFMRWFDIHCGSVRYVFKGDDDVFVNVRNVLEYLSSLRGISARGLFAGDVIWSAAVIRRRDNKYSVPVELYPGARYPPYAGGGGFLMSGEIVRRLWAASHSVDNYPIDDVWLGMCLKEAGGFATQHSGFRTFGIVPRRSTWMNAHACFYRGLLLVHKLMPPELLAMWRDVNDPAIKCVRRKRMSLTMRSAEEDGKAGGKARNGTGPAFVVVGGGGGGGGGGAAAGAGGGGGAVKNSGSIP